jgi:tetratricopeptide (TPR) repeat protein
LAAAGYKSAATWAENEGRILAPALAPEKSTSASSGSRRDFILGAASLVEPVSLPSTTKNHSQSTLHERGKLLFASGSHAAALEAYMSAITAHPNTIRAVLGNISACHCRLKDPEEAVKWAIVAVAS